MLKKELLEILCCPQCKGKLIYKPEQHSLTCPNCSKVYAVKDDIPMMLVNDERR